MERVATETPNDGIELWAGIECTVNRVGDRWLDQIRRSRHWDRIEDLDLFARLGIRALRYPVLWELVAPHGDLARADWSWFDERLGRLRALGIRPVVTLVHHGSGPAGTHLLDPGFPAGLARFAQAVAERYPWILDYTPVNEPLTTARFSALYGHWYPHATDGASFARALVGQCQAIAASMRAVRSVCPEARLVQTEDFGTVTSSPKLKYQADFENLRRWLSLDLLFGRVGSDHRMRPFLLEGASAADLDALQAEPSPPDIVGLNYYVTSDRHLDDDIDRYPACTHGGNGRHCYADVEAVRVPDSGLSGHRASLEAAAERYGRAVALTEVHIDGSRADQMRWYAEAWSGARQAKRSGADVVAVTAWALLGAYDWNSLVTCDAGYYEPGVFDLRSGDGMPRATALAPMLQSLSDSGGFEHPLLAQRGWWRRPCRILFHDAYGGDDGGEDPSDDIDGDDLPATAAPRPLLVIGKTGTLGAAFAAACEEHAIDCVVVGRDEMDIGDPDAVARAIDRHQPWAVVNAAGYVRVDDAETDCDRCFRENCSGPGNLAAICARDGIRLLTFSSDLVFGGEKESPYVESDEPAPLNAYGRSKLAAERLVLEKMPGALVVRTSAFFGPRDQYNFLVHALRCWQAGRPVEAAADQTITATYVPSLARSSLDLLIDGEAGLWHLSNPGPVTWKELAEKLADLTGYARRLVVAQRGLAARAPRPRYSALASERGNLLPDLTASLRRFVDERQALFGDASNARESARRAG